MSDNEAKILKTIKEAATLPAVAVAILQLSQDPRISIEKMAETMEKDPGPGRRSGRGFRGSAGRARPR